MIYYTCIAVNRRVYLTAIGTQLHSHLSLRLWAKRAVMQYRNLSTRFEFRKRSRRKNLIGSVDSKLEKKHCVFHEKQTRNKIIRFFLRRSSQALYFVLVRSKLCVTSHAYAQHNNPVPNNNRRSTVYSPQFILSFPFRSFQPANAPLRAYGAIWRRRFSCWAANISNTNCVYFCFLWKGKTISNTKILRWAFIGKKTR